MNRRQLLKRGLLGGVLLFGAGLAVWPPRSTKLGRLRALSDRSSAVLAAIAGRVVAGCDPERLVERIDGMLAGSPEQVLTDFNRLLALFDNALFALIADGRPMPFSRLAPEAQDAALEDWRSSRLVVRRSGYQALRRLCLSAYYGDRSTHSSVGYPGPHPTGGLFYDRLEGRHMTKLADIQKSPRITDGGKASAPLELAAEVCVIGSGAGGAVSAAVLAEAKKDVLIVEDGGYYTHADFTMNEAEVYPKLYQDRQGRATADLGILVLQGRAVGGTTVVNWTTSFRTPEDVVQHWQKHHAVNGFSYKDLEPHWDWIEKRLCIAEVSDGLVNRNNRLFQTGCNTLGWQVAPLKRNVYSCMSSGLCGMGCPYNAKRSMLVTLIPDAIDAGARLLHSTKIDRLTEQQGEIATAHGTTWSGQAVQIKAKRFVVSGGAINSPALLLRSGINDNDRTGQRTFLHPATLSAALHKEPVEPFYGAPQSMASHHFAHRGDEVGFFLEPAPGHPMLGAGIVPGFGLAHRELFEGLSRSALHVALHIDGFHADTPGGRVTVTESGAPVLDYPISEALWRAFRVSQTRGAELQLAAGASVVYTAHEPPLRMSSKADLALIEQAPWRTSSVGVFSAHQMGGCAVGDDAKTAVVRSEDLRHHRLRNLYVIDGSVFPTSLGVNPQESIYGLARLMAGRLAAL